MTAGSNSSTAGLSTAGGRAKTRASWKVVDGQLAADGAAVAPLLYAVPCKARTSRTSSSKWRRWRGRTATPASTSTRAYQESDFPEKGFEVQINNTATGEGTYRERKKTGSLYGIRNVYKQFVAGRRVVQDARRSCAARTIQIRLNGMLVVDYAEPTPPMIPQAAGEGALPRPRHVRAAMPQRRLAGALPQRAGAPTAGRSPDPRAARRSPTTTFKQIIDVGRAQLSRWSIITCHLKAGPHAGAGARQVAARRHRVRHRGQLRQGLSHRERRRGTARSSTA